MNKLYLIDYGICVKYFENGKHVKFKKGVPFRGNLIFASKHCLMRYSLSRRDDIISLCYLLAFFLQTKFKWIDMSRPVKSQ